MLCVPWSSDPVSPTADALLTCAYRRSIVTLLSGPDPLGGLPLMEAFCRHQGLTYLRQTVNAEPDTEGWAYWEPGLDDPLLVPYVQSEDLREGLLHLPTPSPGPILRALASLLAIADQ